VLLELHLVRHGVLVGVAEAEQGPDAGFRPREDQLVGTAHTDHLIVDDVGRHADQGEVADPLADDLGPGRVRDEVGKALCRQRATRPDVAPDGLGELQELGHAGFLGIVRSSTGTSSCVTDVDRLFSPGAWKATISA
jgi:hypothetical protein